ncbi:DUF4450 domain-containing protein [Massilia horti]|uniref:DUF4450 domain-containing protein n=1 Tax=Massilia horti TaxID=2562153 RepID=A0A4Y9SQG6_9BURK|nr:DUF4450 domain-containing protein [Massilia horti]TFW27727.1 DUF4450 domain-containing protein [Massilia horti]
MTTRPGAMRAIFHGCAMAWAIATAYAAEPAPSATGGLRPNLENQVSQALRYRPEGEDFVIKNGGEFFNRPLYGGNTAFRVDGGDKPEFTLYLPGRGGNLRLAVRTAAGIKWLHDAATIVTRYRPGELRYEIRDPILGNEGTVEIVALAYHSSEGMVVRAQARGLASQAELVWAYGGVNRERGKRDGDIGTERVPISQYFQLQSSFAKGNEITLDQNGFTLKGAATIAGVVPSGAVLHVADAALWNDLPALLQAGQAATSTPVVVGRVQLRNDAPLLLSLQRLDRAQIGDLATYAEVGARKGAQQAQAAPVPRYKPDQLPAAFAATQQHFAALRHQVVIDTPDPYLNAAAGALNVVADALWDDQAQAIMHGSIAWRTKLLGWRGPNALDALGWYDRARLNFDTWLTRQDTSPIPAKLPPADADSHLARSEAALHSNGDMSHSHYDMNMGFIDALFRHLLWTGDLDYARQVWPMIERHLAWEQRLFRREYGPDKLPLYEAYAAIWASDDLFYSGSGAAHSSAYNYYAHRSAARLARLIGKDGSAYDREADLIAQGMRKYLWLPERGAFGEYRDLLGLQRLHPSYALWTFYHTIDSEVPSAQEAWLMAADLRRHLKPIPVTGPGVPTDAGYAVLPSTDWMPYSWSINNVVMGENVHTALALWQAGRAEEAYTLTKSALLASMYMGISPGNVGTLNYLDVYRRESQRDFADGAGVTARALVEGLFGIHPDALAHTLTVRPGFPAGWSHASLRHPAVGLAYQRTGKTERWTLSQPGDRFGKLVLRIPARYNQIREVTANGNAVSWRAAPDAVGNPAVLIDTLMGKQTEIAIVWDGEAIPASKPQQGAGTATGGFVPQRSGEFTWLAPTDAIASSSPYPKPVLEPLDWTRPRTGTQLTMVDLTPWFNDSVTEIYKAGKYLSPRSPYVSLSLPSQGLGAWAGHVNDMAKIDDNGLRQKAPLTMPNGVQFTTPSAAGQHNIIFASRWDNYPAQVVVPLCGKASDAWVLMAGSTNYMQSRIDNGEVVVTYDDGTESRLALTNPENWWPIEEDYFIDDYQFQRPGPRPPRIDLKTGRIRLSGEGKPGQRVDGGAASALHLSLNAGKSLQSLTLRTLSNDVVIGLMALTLEGPKSAKPTAAGAACLSK